MHDDTVLLGYGGTSLGNRISTCRGHYVASKRRDPIT
jgi:hypothetical protein